MNSDQISPVDCTPTAPVGKVIRAVMIGAFLGLCLDPRCVGRWGYMLDDSSWIRPFQVAASGVSDFGVAAYAAVGIPVPMDLVEHLSVFVREWAMESAD